MTATWRFHVDLPGEALDKAEEILESLIDPETDVIVRWEEPDADSGLCALELYFTEKPEEESLSAALAPALDGEGNCRLTPVAAEDWVAYSNALRTPIEAGRFFVHGSHYDKTPPENRIVLRIDAGRAFGTGDHATTKGCLRLLDRLIDRREIGTVLDLGCGTGVLAIAAAKATSARIVAGDIDPQAIEIARENAAVNACPDIDCVTAAGFATERIRAAAPYDLILANILAAPLIELAPEIREHMAPDGIAVLSGLLNKQEKEVRKAFESQGLRLVAREEIDFWPSLALTPG